MDSLTHRFIEHTLQFTVFFSVHYLLKHESGNGCKSLSSAEMRQYSVLMFRLLPNMWFWIVCVCAHSRTVLVLLSYY